MTNLFHNLSNEQLADQIGDLDALVKEQSEHLDAMKAALKSRGVTAVRGEFFAVSITESTSKRLDTKKLRADLGDALDTYEVETTSQRMTIKAAPRLALAG